MRKTLFSLALLACGSVHAQTATEENLGSRVTVDASTTPLTYTFTWWGKFNSHYIVQASTDLLNPWIFIPDFNPSGADGVLGIGYESADPRVFFRVYQFDPTDLSTFADTDTDGLPDIWEQFHFNGLGFNGTDDNEPDTFTNAEELVAGTRPDEAPDASSAAILNLSVWTPFR